MSIRVLTNGRAVSNLPTVNRNSVSVAANPAPGAPAEWVRPADWLAMPDITGQQRFVGLYLIAPDGNFVALSASGNYTVDWGDGTSTNHAAGTIAYKEYNYASIPNTGEATLGYRQVLISVTPQGGQNLTALSLQHRHNQSGLNTSYSPLWLDIAINSVNLTSLTIGGSMVLSALQRCVILDHAVTNMNSMFNSCSSLTTVPLFNTGSVTNMSGMFNGCTSLTSVPLFNTASVTTMSAMFIGCGCLRTVPLFNTASVTSMGSMFNNCTSLTSVPLFNTGSVTNMSAMFNGCLSLTTVPLFNTASVTNMGIMFNGCTSLTSVPAMNAAGATNLSAVAAGGNISRFDMINLKATIIFANQKLSKTELERIFLNLLRSTGSPTITISGNYGADTAVSKTSCGTTSGSKTITQSNTSSLATGMRVTGPGFDAAVSVTFQDTGDTVTLNNHGLDNGTKVSFATITSTTGILTNTRYFVVNATTNTFQLAETQNGTAITLTTNGSGTMRYPAYITAITTNTSITVSAPASSTGTNTLAFRILDTFEPIARGWTVSG